MFAFCMLLDLFPEVFRNRYVVVRSDSITAIASVRKLSASTHSGPLGHLVRVFLGLCVRLNTRIKPEHIPGELNYLADRLSRGLVQRVCGACATMAGGAAGLHVRVASKYE